MRHTVSVEMNKRVICIVTYSAKLCKEQWNWRQTDGDMMVLPVTAITRRHKSIVVRYVQRKMRKNVSFKMKKRVICIVTYSAKSCKEQRNWPEIDGDMIKYRQQTSHDNTKSIVVRCVQRRLRHTVSVEMNKRVICIFTYSAYW
jgi:hypothetical protein